MSRKSAPKPLEVRVATTVRRPRPEVAAVVFEPFYAPGWMNDVRDTEIVSGRPPAVGATFTLVGTRLPIRPSEMFEITEYDADLFLTLRGKNKTLAFEMEGVPVGTVVWMTITSECRGWQRLLRPWILYRRRRAAIGDLRRLKQFIESGDYRTWTMADDGDE